MLGLILFAPYIDLKKWVRICENGRNEAATFHLKNRIYLKPNTSTLLGKNARMRGSMACRVFFTL